MKKLALLAAFALALFAVSLLIGGLSQSGGGVDYLTSGIPTLSCSSGERAWDTTNHLAFRCDAGTWRMEMVGGVNAQTGTSYTVLTSDGGKLVTHTNAAAIAVTLPQAGATTFPAGWCYDAQNRGAGTATITPTTSTIDGAASLALTTAQGARVCSDGSNYFTQRGRVPPPAAAALGGINSKDCTGTGHVLSVNTDGTVTCSADSGGAGGLPDYTTTAWIKDEFPQNTSTTGSIGELGWYAAGTANNGLSSVANHPGIWELGTGAAANTDAYLRLMFNQFNYLLPAETFDAVFIVRLNTNTSNVNQYIGFSDDASGTNPPPANGIYFVKAAADTDWFAVLRVASADKCVAAARVDTTKATDTNWHRFRIQRTAANNIRFTIDGASTVNCTDANATGVVWPWYAIRTAAAATAATADIDFFFLQTTVTR